MATKEEVLENLDEYKNYWNAIHIAADKMSEKLVAGRVYLFVQSTAGGVIVDTAGGDSWDEQLVGIAGDVIGGIIFSPTVNIALTISGNSVGDNVKSYYQDIKADVQSEYWKYEKNYSYMVGGTMVTLDYAKVLYDRNGAVFSGGEQVVQETYELQYNQYISHQNSIQNTINNPNLDVEVNFENGNETVKINNQTYTIKDGDTIWDIAKKIKPENMSIKEVIDDIYDLNEWLITENRISADKEYVLIKPGEKLEVPEYEAEDIEDDFNPGSARRIRRTDPLALDLNHDRQINTSSLEDSQAYFDMDNSGTNERTGWISDGDGLLVVDENKDGKIDNIDELFGNSEVEGYTELRNKFDSNDDNVIDNKDERFNELKVWIDNDDGISEDGELKTLSELNITSINLDNKDTSIETNGNEIFKTSTFTQNGNEYLSGDLNFAVNNRDINMNRFKNDDGNFESDYENFVLPTLRGSGEVVDTTFAYESNDKLKLLAQNMMDDSSAYKNFEEFIKEWTGLNSVHEQYGIDRNSINIDDKEWILETLNGFNFFKPSIEEAYENNTTSGNSYETSYIEEQYHSTLNKNFVAFSLQSCYKDKFAGGYYSVNEDKFIVEDKTKLLNSIASFYNQNLSFEEKVIFTSTYLSLEDDISIISDTLISHITHEDNKAFLEKVFNENIVLSMFQNNFNGSDNDEIVFGTAYDNTLNTNGGDDTLLGSNGDDKLYGGSGDDIYIYNLGDGDDIIDDSDGTDKIVFGENISQEDLDFAIDKLDLVITIDDKSSMTLKDYFNPSKSNSVEKFVFDNNEVSVESLLLFEANVLGGSGDDTLYGTVIDNILRGNSGDDILYGGYGDDVYHYNVGDGHDIIEDVSGTDKIIFGEGINKDDVQYEKIENNLKIILSNTDSITINGWFSGISSYEIERLEFSNGDVITPEQLSKLFLNRIGTNEDNILYGNEVDNILEGKKGDDYLIGGAGNDIYKFNLGDGNDTINDISGVDKIVFGEGIEKNDVRFEAVTHNNLKIIINENNSIIIENGLDDFTKIETLEFSNAETLTYNEIKYDEHLINGTDSNDTIYGLWGNDSIIGGKGDDYLEGLSGNDTYIYNLGDGHDTIAEWGDENKIIFGEGISKDDLTFIKKDKDFIIQLDENSSIKILDGFRSFTYKLNERVSQIEFSDGTIMDFDEIKNQSFIVYENETHIENIFNDGNNTIIGTDENNVIGESFGGGDYNETWIGGKGNDEIYGGSGDDSYIFNLGDGHDTILDDKGLNKIIFSDDIDIMQLSFEKIYLTENNNYQLIVHIDDENSITLQEFIKNDGNQLYINDYLLTLIKSDFYGSDFDDYQLTLKDLNGSISILGFKNSDDMLEGSSVNNRYIFNLGNGHDIIRENGGIDKIVFGEGISASDIKTKINFIDEWKSSIEIYINENDSITIEHSAPLWGEIDTKYLVENFEFNDGTILTFEDILNINMNYTIDYDKKIMNGYVANDILLGSSNSEWLDGYKGNDTLVGQGGDDIYSFTTNQDDNLIIDIHGVDTIFTPTIITSYNFDGDDLLLTNDTNDQIITIQDYKLGNKIELIGMGETATVIEEQLLNLDGDDTLLNTTHDEVLVGGKGDDTYFYNLGDGDDTILDSGGIDKVIFGEGINKNEIRINIETASAYSTNTKFELFMKNGDKLTLYYDDIESFQIENFEFSDGEILTLDDIKEFDHVADGYNDAIKDGNYVFDSTTEDRHLQGGVQNNVYLYEYGSGHDTISDSGGIDVIKFGVGIKSEELSFSKYPNSLVIHLNQNDSITINNWSDDAQKIEKIDFSDGTVLTSNDIENMSLIIIGSDEDDTLSNNTGDDILEGGSGNDIYVVDDSTIINDSDGDDTLKLKNINLLNLFRHYSGDDLVIRFKDNLDKKVVLKNFTTNPIENIVLISEDNIETNITIEDIEYRPLNVENDDVNLLEDSSIDIDVFFNDVNYEGKDKILSVISQIPLHGVLSLNDDGTIKYTPDEDFFGVDSFRYIMKDNNNTKSSEATVNISVENINDKPSITLIESHDINEDNVTINGNIEATDVDGDSLTYTTTANIDGFRLNSDGSYSFNPSHTTYQSLKEREVQTLTIPITVSDGDLTDTKDLIITITGTNDTPVATIDTANVDEDKSVTINVLDNDIDIDGDTITLDSITTNPSNGSVTINDDGTITYNPNADYHGNDSFVYKINDGNGGESQARVNITINSVNDAPIIDSIIPINVHEDEALVTGNITATDIDSSNLTYTTTKNIDGFNLNNDGSYNFNPSHTTYQSLKEGEVQTLTIPVAVSDGELTDTKDLVIKVTGTNDIPTIEVATESYELENTSTQSGIIGDVVDIDGDDLSYSVTTDPTYGTFTIDENGNWSYDPVDSYGGADSVVVSIDDGNGGSVTKTLNFDVKMTNNNPEALDDIVIGTGEVQGEFQVNTYTESHQYSPSITSLGNDGYIIVWESRTQDGNSDGVYAQRYDMNGERIGGERQINTYTSSYQDSSVITTLKYGGYVIAWESTNQDGSQDGIYLQRYNKNDEKVGAETQVNTYTNGNQRDPSIISLEDGGYVVAWQSINQDGDWDGIFTQRYNVDGIVVEGETQVNTHTSSSQTKSSITSMKDGGYIVVWQSLYQDGDGYGVFSQRYDKNNEKVGEETQVNSYTKYYQTEPSISSLEDGGYIITWQSANQDGSGYGIYAQRYDKDGEQVGSETQVNTYTSAYQIQPSITSLKDGGYVIAWESKGQDGDQYGIFAQQYDKKGNKVGNEIQINTYTNSEQKYLDVTSLEDGGYIIAWSSNGQDGSGYGIYAQRFDKDGNKWRHDNTLVASEGEFIIIDVLANDSDIDNDTLSIENIGEVVLNDKTVASTEVVIVDGREQIKLILNSSLNYLKDQEKVNLNFEYTVVDGKGGSSVGNVYLDVLGSSKVVITDIDSLDVNEDDSIVNGNILADGVGDLIYKTSSSIDGFILNEDGSYSFDPSHKSYQELKENEEKIIVIPITVEDNKSSTTENLIITLRGTYDVENKMMVEGTDSNDKIYDTVNHEIIYAAGGNDYIYSKVGEDEIFAGLGDDRIYANQNANDITVSGGKGNDSIWGSQGATTYLYSLGDGKDKIYESQYFSEKVDSIKFDESIKKEDVRFLSYGAGGLKIVLNDNDLILIGNQYLNASETRIEQLEFTDGTILKSSEIYKKLVDSQSGLNISETVYGFENNDDTIYGNGGDDMLLGRSGNDELYGGIGNDTLYSHGGNDTLVGGVGNDYLSGSSGNDTYLFNKGDGIDQVSEYYGSDTILFNNTIKENNISFRVDNQDLKISYGETDEVSINKYFDTSTSKYEIERVELANGNYLTNNDIDQLIQDINSYADNNGIDISSHDNIKANEQLMNIISSSWNRAS
jgi:VCBS repeat-containing protein